VKPVRIETATKAGACGGTVLEIALFTVLSLETFYRIYAEIC
jgi:hypothetical protein